MSTSTKWTGQEPGGTDLDALHMAGALLDPPEAEVEFAFRSGQARLTSELGSVVAAADGQHEHSAGSGLLRAVRGPGGRRGSADGRRPGGRRRTGGTRRPAVRTAVGLGLAATVAGGLLFAPTATLSMPWDDDGGDAAAVPPGSASAAEILQAAATRTVAAADDSWEHIRPDQFVYTHSTGTTRDEIVGEKPQISLEEAESWIWTSVDGTQDGLSAGTLGEEPYREYPLYTCAGGGRERALTDGGGDCDSTPGLDLDAPTDADAMYDYLQHHPWSEGDSSATSMFTHANDLLGYLTPRSQAAVFGALSRVDGLIVTPGVTDAAGRPGIAVGVDMGGYRQDLIFDPETKDLLGGASFYPDGMVDGHAIVERTLVDEVNQKP
jgi:hypothetical protein